MCGKCLTSTLSEGKKLISFHLGELLSYLVCVCVCAHRHTRLPAFLYLTFSCLFSFTHSLAAALLSVEAEKKMGGWVSGVKSPPHITPEMEHKEIIWVHTPWLVALKRGADLNGISCYQWRNLCQEMWGILGITLPCPHFFSPFETGNHSWQACPNFLSSASCHRKNVLGIVWAFPQELCTPCRKLLFRLQPG